MQLDVGRAVDDQDAQPEAVGEVAGHAPLLARHKAEVGGDADIDAAMV